MYAEFKGSWFPEIIGSFLMVALTVFMAAVVAAYVMGMMEGAPQPHAVVVTSPRSRTGRTCSRTMAVPTIPISHR